MSDRKRVVIFDGDCAFCRQQIDRIRRWDRQECFEYVARQTPGLDERFPRLAEGQFDTGMRLIDLGGQIYIGADAVYQIVRNLPRWRRLAWLYRVPVLHWLAKKVYAQVAARRQKLGKTCQEGACRVE